MKISKFPIVFLILTLVACGVIPGASTEEIPNLETVVASTIQALTVAPPATGASPAVVGVPVSYENISFVIPLELKASAIPARTSDVGFPYINPSHGPMPEHVVFEFINFGVAGQARIMVFTSSDYAAYSDVLQDTVTALLTGQDKADPLPEALTEGDFYLQVKRVNFQNGHGVRYLTQVLTGIAPINNQDIFYFYQGLTHDGSWFVSAIFHTQVSFLVADGSSNSPTPPEGVPFNWSGDLNFQQYLNDVAQKINNANASDFFPSLEALDAMIQSLLISTP